MGKRKVVLCIDDEPSVLTVHEMVLQVAGFGTLTAANANEGLAIFASRAVDAVLLDYRLPGMDGGEVAALMKKTKPGVPILMLSAQASAPENAAPWIDGFISKGHSPEGWLEMLAELLENAPVKEAGYGLSAFPDLASA